MTRRKRPFPFYMGMRLPKPGMKYKSSSWAKPSPLCESPWQLRSCRSAGLLSLVLSIKSSPNTSKFTLAGLAAVPEAWRKRT